MAPGAVTIDRLPIHWGSPIENVDAEDTSPEKHRETVEESVPVPTKRRTGDFIIGIAVPYLEVIQRDGPHLRGAEGVRPGAFRRFLKHYAPVTARVDHDSNPIGSTSDASLRLWEVSHGLAYALWLRPSNVLEQVIRVRRAARAGRLVGASVTWDATRIKSRAVNGVEWITDAWINEVSLVISLAPDYSLTSATLDSPEVRRRLHLTDRESAAQISACRNQLTY